MNTVMHLNWMEKIDLSGPRLPTLALVLVCCARILLYAKMLKETKTEKTKHFLVIIIVIGGISIGGGGRF